MDRTEFKQQLETNYPNHRFIWSDRKKILNVARQELDRDTTPEWFDDQPETEAQEQEVEDGFSSEDS